MIALAARIGTEIASLRRCSATRFQSRRDRNPLLGLKIKEAKMRAVSEYKNPRNETARKTATLHSVKYLGRHHRLLQGFVKL